MSPSINEVSRGISADIGAASARALLGSVLDKSAAELIRDADALIDLGAINKINSMAAKIKQGVPLSRLVGRREFYGLEFKLSRGVLDPRPDSEALVDAALKFYKNKRAKFLELGIGSGCLSCAILFNAPHLYGLGVDLSRHALRQTRINAANLQVRERLQVRHSNWFANVAAQKQFDFIISNPPYIKSGDIAGLAREVKCADPHLALCGGADGLRSYREIISAAPKYLARGGRIILELGAVGGEAKAVSALLAANGFAAPEILYDLARRERGIISVYKS